MVESLSAVKEHLEENRNLQVQSVNLSDLIGQSYRLLMSRSMPDIFQAVNEAVSRGVSSLLAESDVRILGCHLTLYDARSQIFHSPIRPDSLVTKEVEPDRVILLIDDIYDLLDHLSSQGDIFDQETQSSWVLDSLRKAARVPSKAGERDRSLAALDSECTSLLRVLAWRRSEMIAAEALAASLNVPLYLVGLKHPVEMAPLLFGEKAPAAVYVSHPITRHRREQIACGEWSQDVRNLNRIPQGLAARSVLALMPTAIDELRFQPPEAEDIFVRRGGRLAARWPSMESNFSLINQRYSPGQTEHIGIKALDDAFVCEPRVASVYARVIES